MGAQTDGEEDPEALLVVNHFELEHFELESRPLSSSQGACDEEEGGVAGPAHWLARLLARLLQPWNWLLGLANQLNSSFVSGIIVAYGVSQGFGGAFGRVAIDYYWKDVQKAAPWKVQAYTGITFTPWNVKPIYGFLTDAFPVAGYRRRPYFILSGLLGLASAAGIMLGGKLHPAVAVALLTTSSMSVAIADVTIDAEVARNTREHPRLGPDMQALCTSCSSIGGLVGAATSGLAVDALGSQGAIGILMMPAALFLILGLTFYEELYSRDKQVWKRLRHLVAETWATVSRPQVWKPTLYMYLTWALCPRISKAKFYWYTDKDVGPGFSEEFIGLMYGFGAIGGLGAAFLYNLYLRDYSFRSLLQWIQIVLAAAGMLDLLLIFRINLRLYLPDALFVLLDEGLTMALYKLKWMPLVVLAGMLCPPGIEGTFFAFLMSVDNMGTWSGEMNGGILLKILKVDRVNTPTGPGRTNFKNLWLAIVIRNLMLLLPLLFIRMVPEAGPRDHILDYAALDGSLSQPSDGMEDSQKEDLICHRTVTSRESPSAATAH